jgi:hypothetical protein
MEEDDGITDEDRMEFSDTDDNNHSFEDLDNDQFVKEEERLGVKNSHLAVGWVFYLIFKVSESMTKVFPTQLTDLRRYTHDRSFVVRGSRIGVFKHTDNKLKFETTIKHISDPKTREIFSPKKVMLHQQDSSMLLLHPNDSTKIFKMDLERGSVVEEWVHWQIQQLKYTTTHSLLLTILLSLSFFRQLQDKPYRN